MDKARIPATPLQRFWRYLPEDPLAMASGLTVTGAGWSRIAPGSPYPPGGHPQSYQFAWDRGRVLQEFQLIYLTQGTGMFESTSAGRQTLAAGDLITLVPGVWHRYRPAAAVGWHEYWVSFRGDQAMRWRHQGLLDTPAGVTSLGLRSELVLGFRAIGDLLAHQPAGFALLAAARIGMLVAEIHAAIRSKDESPLAEAVRTACAQLSERPQATLRITRLAGELGVSERSLRRAFVAQTGLSPKRWLLALRLAEAERLLSQGVMVADVAHACGFTCRSFFSRRFKARYGYSPVQAQPAPTQRGTRPPGS